MPLHQAKYLLTELDCFWLSSTQVHTLISIRFALARRRVGLSRLVNVLLIAFGILSFWFVLSIR